MQLFLKRHSPLFISLAAMLALYIPWLNRGYSNWEFSFPMAARALTNGGYESQIEAYFYNQANPLGYSIFLSLFYRIIGVNQLFWFSRLPSILGCAFILSAVWVARDLFGLNDRRKFQTFASLLCLNPLVFIFSTTAVADVLPVGILSLSLVLGYKNTLKWNLSSVIGSLLLGAAIVVKYPTIYLALLFVAAIAFGNGKSLILNKKIVIKIFAALFVSATVLLAYLFWSNKYYGNFRASSLSSSYRSFFRGSDFFINFGKYLSFFGMFFGPIVLVIAFRKLISSSRFERVFLVGGIFIFGSLGWYISDRVAGELDFGLVFGTSSNFPRLIQTIGFISGALFFGIVPMSNKINFTFKILFWFGVLPFLFLISLSRPSQRYLTYLVPISVLFVIEFSRRLSVKLRFGALALTCCAFAGVSLLGMSYLRAQGNASEQMAVWIEENGLISETSPGVIFPHSGQHFWGIEVKKIRYEVIAVTPEDELKVGEKVLHREPMNVLGKITRVYLLREVSKSP
jgi:hypothetical protein